MAESRKFLEVLVDHRPVLRNETDSYNVETIKKTKIYYYGSHGHTSQSRIETSQYLIDMSIQEEAIHKDLPVSKFYFKGFIIATSRNQIRIRHIADTSSLSKFHLACDQYCYTLTDISTAT